jgi:hypothetical protein
MESDNQFFVWAIFWIGVSSVIGYMIGKPKGMGFASALLSVFLGPFGWIAALCSKGNLRRCPHCAENVKPDALVCRYCRGELPVLAPAPPQTAGVAIVGGIIAVIIGGIIWMVRYLG